MRNFASELTEPPELLSREVVRMLKVRRTLLCLGVGMAKIQTIGGRTVNHPG